MKTIGQVAYEEFRAQFKTGELEWEQLASPKESKARVQERWEAIAQAVAEKIVAEAVGPFRVPRQT